MNEATSSHPEASLPQSLTKRQLASVLHVSTRTVEVLVKTGRLPKGRRRGRFLHWDASVVSKWYQSAFAEQIGWNAEL